MMPSTYTPIATTTLTSSSASVTFSSIPQTYTDLVVVMNAIVNVSPAFHNTSFNGDTATNYSTTWIVGDGSSAASARQANNSVIAGFAANPEALYILNIMNYSNTTTFKSTLARTSNVNTSISAALVGLYRSTSAINSITIAGSNNNYSAGTTATLYGIKAA
jgi:hypothetical protein